MGRKLFLPAAAVAFVMLIMAAVMNVTKLAASDSSPTFPVSTQNFSPARYAVAAAEINVAVLQSSGLPCVRKVLVRLDSVTGKLHVLQMSIRGDNDPTVMSAVWTPASETGYFQPYGAPTQQNVLPNQLND